MKALLIALGLVNEVWGLIFKLALVVIAIAIVVGFVISCSNNSSLNEHSSCQQFEQADATTQDKVLQDMEVAHGGSGKDITLTRASVELYCNFHDPSAPIDGIYSGNVQPQPVQALHLSAPLIAWGEARARTAA